MAGRSCRNRHRIACISVDNLPHTCYMDKDEDEDGKNSCETYDTPFKGRRKSILWLFDKSYPNTGDTKKDPTDWSIYRTHNTVSGKKKFFQCNRVKLRAEQCSGAMYLLYDATEEKVIRFKTTEECNNELLGINTQRELCTDVRVEIEKLYNMNVKPKGVLESLTKMTEYPMPSKAQLNNYLSCLRKDKGKPAKVNYEKLSARLKERSIPSANEHASFIVAYDVSPPNSKNPTFRFFISTKHLIGLARKAEIIQASATFNLSWQTFPMFVSGTTDKDNTFHPFGLLVSKQEDAQEFQFFFTALKEAVKGYHKTDIHPNYLMCNAEDNIRKPFTMVFGSDSVMLTCWAHVRKSIIKLVLNFIPPNHRVEILSDIDTLQVAATKEIFNKACSCFLEKWKHEEQFCNIFESNWVNQNQNWFEGAASGFPSTNNALEAFCIFLKGSNTLRVRYTLESFLTKAMDIVSDWSSDYKLGNKKFSVTPTISQKLWAESYKWAKLPKSILKSGNKDNWSFYRVPAKDNITAIERVKSWCTFDSYKDLYFNECQVSLPLEKEGWLRGKCSCPSFLKSFMCKHILGMAITLKEIKVPAEVRKERIGDSLKRMRSKASKTTRTD